MRITPNDGPSLHDLSRDVPPGLHAGFHHAGGQWLTCLAELHPQICVTGQRTQVPLVTGREEVRPMLRTCHWWYTIPVIPLEHHADAKTKSSSSNHAPL